MSDWSLNLIGTKSHRDTAQHKSVGGREWKRTVARAEKRAEKQRIKEKAALARQPIQKQQQLSAAILPTAAHKCKEAV